MLSVYLTEFYSANSAGKLPVGFHITVCGKSLRCAEVLLQPGITDTRVSGFYGHFSPEQHEVRRLHPQRTVRHFFLSDAEFPYCHDFCVPAFPAMNGP